MDTSIFTTVLPMLVGLIWFFALVLLIVVIAIWKIFMKAGEEGWKALVPIYNMIVFLKIVGKPWWWIFFSFFSWIPFVGALFSIASIVLGVWQLNMLSHSFGKGVGFTLGLIFLPFIFFPILAFGSAQYQGPYGDKAAFDAYRQRNQGFDFERNKLSQD
jgi:Family of unknown function (DUF5684)